MKRVVELFLLVVLVGVGYVGYSLYLGDGNTPFYREIRDNVLKSTLTRSFLGLNEPGDHRFAYLSKQNDRITVEVDIQSGKEPDARYKDWLETMIKKTTGKTAVIQEAVDESLGSRGEYSYTELLTLAKKSREPILSTQENYLHVVYISSSSDEPTNAGMVLTATDMFIFKDVVESLSDRTNIRSRIEQSTLMHEWGHLLGLDHVEGEGCIMAETVEVYEKRRYQSGNIPTDYCAAEWDLLTKIKKEIKE